MVHALDGITVVEFSSNLAAAYAAMLLAEHGALAVKIEPLGGAAGRGTPHFHVANRSKRAVALDFDSPDGRERAREFIRAADVVVTGFGPAKLRALGLDFPAIHELNPRALVLNLPTFGS